MMFSVWNQGAEAFDYYEDGRAQDVLNVEKPAHLVNRTLGSTVDQAAWPLPSDARLVGRGPVPVGRIAARRGAGALGDVADRSLVTVGLVALAAVAAWRLLSPRRTR